MTLDAVALCRDEPDLAAALAGLPVRPVPGTPLLQVCSAGGDALATVEGPVLVPDPGEAERLLGVAVDGPVWWVEVRARDRAAHDLARRLVGALAAATGGRAWPGP